MRLVSYRANGAFRAGILHDGRVVDAGPSIRDLLGLGADRLRELAASGDPVDAGSLELGPPVPDPPKIICLGLNYRDHAREAGLQAPCRADLLRQVGQLADRPD